MEEVKEFGLNSLIIGPHMHSSSRGLQLERKRKGKFSFSKQIEKKQEGRSALGIGSVSDLEVLKTHYHQQLQAFPVILGNLETVHY